MWLMMKMLLLSLFNTKPADSQEEGEKMAAQTRRNGLQKRNSFVPSSSLIIS